jgi:small subunit ribosomal protein S13
MPRIAGVDIPNDKRICIALRYVYGIGPKNALDILKSVNINPDTRSKDLTEDELSRLGATIEDHYVTEGTLRRQEQQNIARLRDIRCYRGIRHRLGLPVRGQRTRTNARTRKGPRKTVAVKKGVKETHT